jgi:hypothetical protein
LRNTDDGGATDASYSRRQGRGSVLEGYRAVVVAVRGARVMEVILDHVVDVIPVVEATVGDVVFVASVLDHRVAAARAVRMELALMWLVTTHG